MFKIFRKELDWGGTRLVLETGKVARQAALVALKAGAICPVRVLNL